MRLWAMGGLFSCFALFPWAAEAQAPSDFPDLTVAAASQVLLSHIDCPAGFRVVSVVGYEPDQRVVTVRLESSRWLQVRALFEWAYGDMDHWDGAGHPPGEWKFVSMFDAFTGAVAKRPVSDPRFRQAVEQMQSIALALEAFKVDNNFYPAANLSQLQKKLSPVYVRYALPRVDPWGRPYLYRTDPSRPEHFVLASAGPDGVYQISEKELAALAREGAAGRLPEVSTPSDTIDLVVSDGRFLFGLEPVEIAAPESPISSLACSQKKLIPR